MKAEARVANLVSVELCSSDCVFAEGHSTAPDFIKIPSRITEDMETVATVTSNNGTINETEVLIPGIIRQQDAIEKFADKPETVTNEKLVACNALCALAELKRKNNGREEISA